MTNAVTTRQPNPLDADAGRLIRYLQRGGNKNYYTTFDADGWPRQAWYATGAEPPALPDGATHFGVNPCTAIPETNAAGEPRRPANVRGRKEYIAALNCLFADFDAKDFGGSLDETLAYIRSLAVQPSVIVASGGGYHCYWLLAEPFVLDTPEKRQRAADVQARWTTFVRGDKAAKDIARVLRVPGTLNAKYSPPRPVAFVEQDYSRTYTLDALQAMLPAPAPRKARTPKADAPACQTDGLQPSVDFVDVSKAAAALARLSTARRDDYQNGGWINVGMALKGLGAIGYELWRAWSESSPKYNVGDCERKWPTFRVGVPGSTDITLASLYWYADVDAGEPVSSLDDAERLQLQDLQARDVQTQRIMAMKAVVIGMLPRLDARHVLVANKDGHTGSLAVDYSQFADLMNTNKTAIGKAVELGERAGLWRKDAEYKQTKSGYDIKLMRLDLQPAFFRPELAEPIPETRGGKRAGAGRKPTCPDCPPRTRVLRKTEITYVCGGCRQVLDAEPSRFELMPDDAPAAAEFKTVSGYVTPAGYEPEREPVDAPAANVETNADEFKTVSVVVPAAVAWCLPETVLKKTRAELVPVALTETAERPPTLVPV